MSVADWAYLAARVPAEFANGGHRTFHIPTMNAIANSAIDVSAFATASQAAATAAAGSLATQLLLGTPAAGIGNEPMDVPRMSMFGGGAVTPWDLPMALVPDTRNAAYQITEHDTGKLLLCTSGANTWTLPAASADLVGWTTRLRNRSGNNLTLARTGSDTINGAGSNLTIATASVMITVVCTSATGWEVA